MAEVFDELLVSLQSKNDTLRHGSGRRSRAGIKSSASLSSTSSSSSSLPCSPPGSGGIVGGGVAIRRGGRAAAVLSLSEEAKNPAAGPSAAHPSAGEFGPGRERNVSVTDLVHEFLGDPNGQRLDYAFDNSSTTGWRTGVLKSTSHESIGPPHLMSVLSPQLPMRTIKRAKALDPQRLLEAERFALEALGSSASDFVVRPHDNELAEAAEPIGTNVGGGGAPRSEGRMRKDEEWESLMQGLSANASHSRDAEEAKSGVAPQHHPHSHHHHHQAQAYAKASPVAEDEEDDEEVKRKTATLEQLLAQLDVDSFAEPSHGVMLSDSSTPSLSADEAYYRRGPAMPIPDEGAVPGLFIDRAHQHHHPQSVAPISQQRSYSSPALFGPAPTQQERRVDMRLLNEQLNDGPILPNDRDAVRLEKSAPPGTCARCHQHIPSGAAKLKALDRIYHPGCWVCNQCLRPLNTGAFFMLKGVPHCQYCTYKLTLPVCHHCGDSIKDAPVRIGDQKWHRSCLQCMQCKRSLQYEVCNDQHGVPLCTACAEPTATFYCAGCSMAIHDEVFVAMNRNWHEGCFVCNVCRTPFEHAFYAGPDGRPYCPLHIRPARSVTS